MAAKRTRKSVTAERNPDWYQDAIIYQLHVRAFLDSNGDGVGDFRGLAQKLDYIQDLGVSAIWLLPFYPSPLQDDGYDIADYVNVHPKYGTLKDFKNFLREAHRRDLRVITELVINHTSDQHRWFQQARRAKPGTKTRNFYVWSDDPARYSDARIIFQDFETSNWTWDPVAGAYYWHRFYSHQPDLNYENPDVQRAVIKVLDFWMRMGVDGFRLDAVPYLYEREGTTCENLPETHEFLKKLRRHVDEHFEDRMLLAEANQWPEDAAAYFGDGDECHMNFNFPLMPRLFMALHREDRFPVVDILQQTPSIPANCQWAIFLRNHDELTLEMVTDEERDFMYRVYAEDPQSRVNLGIRRRLASLLGNSRRKIELLNGLLFSLPGTPIVYYGDEIGMGDNIYLGDRDSVRTPMQWNADRNAGFSRANPQKVYLPVVVDPEFHYTANNVEAQDNNPQSLLWWMKRLVRLRKRFRVFGRGSLEFLYPENPKVLAFLRQYEDETVLVVANLSRFAQYLELDLSRFNGMVPVELFGQTRFPPIGELPYLLTLGPHSFYLFSLEQQVCVIRTVTENQLPTCRVNQRWEQVFGGKTKSRLESALPEFLNRQSWFLGEGATIQNVELLDAIPVENGSDPPSKRPTASGAAPFVFCIGIVRVTYVDRDPEIYILPLSWAAETKAGEVMHRNPGDALAWVEVVEDGTKGLLYDATHDSETFEMLLEAIARRRRFKGKNRQVVAIQTRAFRRLHGSDEDLPAPSMYTSQQNHTSVVYGDRLILKLFRRVDQRSNPDLEISRFLTEKARLPQVPPLAGALELSRDDAEPLTLAVLHQYLPNEGNAWNYTLDELGRYFERVTAHSAEEKPTPDWSADCPLLKLAEQEPTELARTMIGTYLQSADFLGQQTAELHRALASDKSDSRFAPEPFSSFYQRGLYQSMRSQAVQSFALLRRRLKGLPESDRALAERVLQNENKLEERFQALRQRKITALRIRCHGSYYLGQLLYTGKEFAVVDFQGELHRPVSERRIKRSPLRDVAAMIGSFYYASRAALLGNVPGIGERPADSTSIREWADFWFAYSSAAFLRAYLHAAEPAGFLPKTTDELRVLINAYMLEKAAYELQDELNNRPEWVTIPLEGILLLVNCGA